MIFSIKRCSFLYDHLLLPTVPLPYRPFLETVGFADFTLVCGYETTSETFLLGVLVDRVVSPHTLTL